MGEVYRARDTKLNRDVALNHPNIAAIYGFERGPVAAADDGPAKAGHYSGANVVSGFSRT